MKRLFSLSQRRVQGMIKSVESMDRAVMLLKALPNICYSDYLNLSHKIHHRGIRRIMGSILSQRAMLFIPRRLYICAHHSLPFSLLLSFYPMLNCIENLDILHWKISFSSYFCLSPQAPSKWMEGGVNLVSSSHRYQTPNANMNIGKRSNASPGRENQKAARTTKKSKNVSTKTKSAQQPPPTGKTRMVHGEMEYRSKDGWGKFNISLSLSPVW